MNILGLSAYYHDSAAALVVDGRLVAAAQEERFTRKKHDSRFPSQAVAYCLSSQQLTLTDIDYVVFYDKPLLKFDRLLETYLTYAPKGFRSFVAAMPIWLKEKLFLKTVCARSCARLPRPRRRLYPRFCLPSITNRTRHPRFIPALFNTPRFCVWTAWANGRPLRFGEETVRLSHQNGKSTFRTRLVCSTRLSPTSPVSG